MAKIIALKFPAGKLAEFLRDHGYTVIDMYEASYPGQAVDAILYTCYHPDMVSFPFSLAETADITLGNLHHESQDYLAALPFNITGLNPEQILDLLQQRLPRLRFNAPDLRA